MEKGQTVNKPQTKERQRKHPHLFTLKSLVRMQFLIHLFIV